MNFKQISVFLMFFIFTNFSFAEPYKSSQRPAYDKKPSKYQTRNKPISVIAYQVTQQSIPDNIELLGNLKSNLAVDITTNITKVITKLHFKETDFVKKGQLLITLNSAEERAMLAEAKINTAEAKSQYRRVKKLEGRGSITLSVIDEAYRKWQANSAKQKIILTKIKQHSIYAPFSGQLGFSDLTVGSLVKSGTSIINLYNNQQMKLDLLIPSRYLNAIQINQPLIIQANSFPKQVFNGKITAISPSIHQNLHMLQARAVIENRQQLLKNNMLVNAELTLPLQQQVVIPNTALLMLGEKKFVYKLVKNIEKSTAEKQLFNLQKIAITTGKRGNKFIQILSGLEIDDIIISQGLLKVSARKIVSIQKMQGNN